MKNKKKVIIISGLFAVLAILAIGIIYMLYRQSTPQQALTDNVDLPVYTIETLALYDATDPNKPIYIGLNGYVYDVTEGKQFYQVGAGYHFLAGKDSSADLNIIGGDIIARKYKIIGRLQ